MTCHLCGRDFDPQQSLDTPEQLAGQLLAEEDYGDSGKVCAVCLASRGRLAMMYRSDCF